MNKITMKIWGREFDLEVYIRKSQNSDIAFLQEKAYNKFMESQSVIDEAEKSLISYIEKNYRNDLTENKVENIFKYVIPKTLFLPRMVKERTVALLCDFKFDIEHGLAVVFENEKFKEIVSQDEVL